jgi:hypothetical protein
MLAVTVLSVVLVVLPYDNVEGRTLVSDAVKGHDDDLEEVHQVMSLGSPQSDATAFITAALDGFPDVIRSGYPDLGYPSLDPYDMGKMDITVEFNEIGFFEFTLKHSVLVGESNISLTDLLVYGFGDNITWNVDLDTVVGPLLFTSTYEMDGYINGDYVYGAGDCNFTALGVREALWLDMIYNNNKYFLYLYTETDDLVNGTVTFTGMPDNAMDMIDDQYHKVVKTFFQSIHFYDYVIEEEALFREYLRQLQVNVTTSTTDPQVTGLGY